MPRILNHGQDLSVPNYENHSPNEGGIVKAG